MLLKKAVGWLALGALAWISPAAAQLLEVSGATTLQRRVLEPGAEALRGATGIQLKIYAPGTRRGMLAPFDGKVPVAAVYHQVAADNIVVAVHASGPVKSLGRQQIR